MNKPFSIILLIASVFILQFHAVGFWLEFAGLIGILWSLIIESAALYFWFNRKNTLAIITSVLVIVTPLYQIATPLLNSNEKLLQKTISNKSQIKALQNQIITFEKSLQQFNENSKNRAGWLNIIQDTQNKISTANNKISNLADFNTAKVILKWQAKAVVIIQMMALLIFQILNILIIRSFGVQKTSIFNASKRSVKKTPKNKQVLTQEIMMIFDEQNTDKLTTGALVDFCNQKNNSSFTARQLTKELKKSGIKTKSIRFGNAVQRGFEKRQFLTGEAK